MGRARAALGTGVSFVHTLHHAGLASQTLGCIIKRTDYFIRTRQSL